MDISAALVAECSPATLYRWVHDLADYPHWLGLVHRAVRDSAVADDPAELAWSVELRARIGPLARSKRLRMLRTEAVENELVRFERREVDGRRHSTWVLQAQIVDVSASTTAHGAAAPTELTELTELTMSLHYGGGLWSGAVLERVLNDQINTGRDRLKALVESRAGVPPNV